MKGMFLKDIISGRKRIIITIISTIGVMGFMALIVLSLCYGNIRMIIDEDFIDVKLGSCLQAINFAGACLIGYLTTITTTAFSDDKKGNFEKVRMSLPISDFQHVSGRYLYYLTFFGIELVIFLCTCPFIYNIANVKFAMEDVCITLSAFCVSLIVILVELPIIYIFEYKITQVLNICAFIVICIVLYSVFNYITEQGILISEVVKWINKLVKGLAIFLPIGMTFGMLVSCGISTNICRKKRGY